MIDTLPGPELEKLIRQIEKAWPSVAPNPLLLPDKGEETKEKQAEPVPSSEKKDIRPSTAQDMPPSSHFRFAQHETSTEEPAAGGTAEGGPVETLPVPEQPAPLNEKAGPDNPALGGLNNAVAGKAPVSITVGPDGRLVITSEDTQALDRLQELLANLAPAQPITRSSD